MLTDCCTNISLSYLYILYINHICTFYISSTTLTDKKFHSLCDRIFTKSVSYLAIYKIYNININLNKSTYYFIAISYRCSFSLWKSGFFFFQIFLRGGGVCKCILLCFYRGMLLSTCTWKFLYKLLTRLPG